MSPRPAAGEVNCDGTVPIGSEAMVLPDAASRAMRWPSLVATVQTAPPAMIVGPGCDRGAVQPTLNVSPDTMTWTTPFEQGTKSVLPSCATPPKARVSLRTGPAWSWPPIPPRCSALRR